MELNSLRNREYQPKHAALQLKQINFFIFKATVGTCYAVHSSSLLLLECIIVCLQRMVWKQFIVFFPVVLWKWKYKVLNPIILMNRTQCWDDNELTLVKVCLYYDFLLIKTNFMANGLTLSQFDADTYYGLGQFFL